jgi:hypothetical protein
MSINKIPKSESFEAGNTFLSQMKLRKSYQYWIFHKPVLYSATLEARSTPKDWADKAHKQDFKI